MSRISCPALGFVLAVVAVITLLVTSMPTESDRKLRAALEAQTSSVDAAVEAPVDELGRWIVMLGEVELRIPKKSRSQPPASTTYEIYPLAICVNEQDGLADCFEQRDRVRIFLLAQPLNAPMPACNIDRDYTRGNYGGPFKTANAEVEFYESESGTMRHYVYRKSGEDCRHPTTRCGGPGCNVQFTPRPGMTVRYTFPTDSIIQWPSIHLRVNEHVTPLYVW